MAWYDSVKDMPDMIGSLFEKAGDAVGGLLGAAKDGVGGVFIAARNGIDSLLGNSEPAAMGASMEVAPTSAPTIHQPIEAPTRSITEVMSDLPSHIAQMVQQIKDNPIQLASQDLSPAGQVPDMYPPAQQSTPFVGRASGQGVTV